VATPPRGAAATTADDVAASAKFMADFTRLIDEGRVYSPEQQRDICESYGLTWPLPGGFALQDAYFRPRLALRHARHLVNGDVVVDSLADPSVADRDPAAFHALREKSCVDTLVRLIDECDNEVPFVGPTDGSNHHHHHQHPLTATVPMGTARRIVVLWGHFHCPRMLEALMAAPMAGAVFTGEPQWAQDAVTYGWSMQMMNSVYGI
jgi:hypothetical protein